ncbi:hypothetical protein K1719_025785 [Acacia pycnantha]|nr:hypothetical protein K1719_025785 [Acacia pycnantha]
MDGKVAKKDFDLTHICSLLHLLPPYGLQNAPVFHGCVDLRLLQFQHHLLEINATFYRPAGFVRRENSLTGIGHICSA